MWAVASVLAALVIFIGILVFNVIRRKKAEKALRDYQDRLEQLVEERTAKLQEANKSLEAEMEQRAHAQERLQNALSDLRESNQQLEQFAYVASHDLQEPLRKIIGFGERLQKLAGDQLDEKARDHLDRIIKATQRMQALIDDLLAFSRITRKAQPFTQVDMNEVIKDVLSDVEPLLRKTSGRVDVGELCTIDAEPVQMRQLMQNLISNGLKFHKENEPPFVKVYCTNTTTEAPGAAGAETSMCSITVEDNGIGFEEKYKHQLFGIFQRLHNGEKYQGTGIGLALCERIVDYHGGWITASSAPGEGSKFVVTLPIKQSPASKEQTKTQAL